jgi:hypothetical protein
MVNAASLSLPTKNRCRRIERSDVDSIVGLLTRGFSGPPATYWRHVMSRLELHPTPSGYPKYGYLLESEGAAVGVILQIFTATEEAGALNTRCYLSSWYVEPAFRSYAPLLVSTAIKRKEVTYVNVSPDPRTWPIIEAQGFSRYSKGQYRAIPLLSLRSENCRIREVRGSDSAKARPRVLMPRMLADHAEYGCLSLVCETSDGEYPFVFELKRICKGFLPCAQLIYCRDVADLVRFARPIGRFLLDQRIPCISIDANGKIKGLAGMYFDGRAPKYCKGPQPPRHGDLAYTESVLFGVPAAEKSSPQRPSQALVQPCANDQ